MIALTVYDASTGEIRRVVRGPQIEELSDMIGPDEAVLPGEIDGAEVYIVDGQPVSYPPKPGHWAVFDYATGEWTDPRTEADLVAQLQNSKIRAIRAVNAGAAGVRTKFVTVIPGQEMLYLRKEAEALMWVADPDPDLVNYPLIAAEIGITGEDGDQIAQVWLNMAAIWVDVAARLEATRLAAIGRISAAQAEGEVEAALDAFNTAVAPLAQ